jgi:hypothetical protein
LCIIYPSSASEFSRTHFSRAKKPFTFVIPSDEPAPGEESRDLLFEFSRSLFSRTAGVLTTMRALLTAAKEMSYRRWKRRGFSPAKSGDIGSGFSRGRG